MRIATLLTLLILAWPAWSSNSFPEQLAKFRSSMLTEEPLGRYDLNRIHRDYPKALLLPGSLLPQSANYPLRSLKRLYQASEKCQGPWPVSPLVTDPLVFTRAICNNTFLPSGWFSRSNLIHPGGGSYAAKYVEKFPARQEKLERFFHIKERSLATPDTLLGKLQRMPEDGVIALTSGAEALLSGEELWLRVGSEYWVYPRSTWLSNVSQFGLIANEVGAGKFCLLKAGNICWDEVKAPSYWSQLVIILLIINLLGLTAWFYNRWTVKRRLMQERMLVLQILTHELRTPIASLLMTVEGFRRKFDNLPEPLYDEFKRLCEDSRRLKQLAEASKDYLQSNQQQLHREHIPSVQEWLQFVCDERKVTLSLENDAPVSVNVYWLTTSLDNLISNAVKYGEPPVSVHASVKDGWLTIRVVDQGKLTPKDWKNIRKPFVSEQGLGLGLTIVESMIERMGGKLTLEGPPTSFILEIPCDASDITAR